MRSTLELVERLLDPDQFTRVKPGAIVNVDRIKRTAAVDEWRVPGSA